MITLGVIGCGYWGPNLLRNFADTEGASVKWVCDLDVERTRGLTRRYPTLCATRSAEEVIGDPAVDAVVIATPVATHAPLARAALDAVEAGELDPDIFRPGALDVLAQHVMGLACAAPFDAAELLREIQGALPYSALSEDVFEAVLNFIADGGYALRAYDRFKRLTHDPDGNWRVSHPRFIQQHRLNAGIIVDQPALAVRFEQACLK